MCATPFFLVHVLIGLLVLLVGLKIGRFLAWRRFARRGGFGPHGRGRWAHGRGGPWQGGPQGGHWSRAHGRWEVHLHSDPDDGEARGPDPAAVGRAAAEVFKRRVGVGPEQEDIVDHGLRDLLDALKAGAQARAQARAQAAAAFGGAQVDEAALTLALDQGDEGARAARRDVLSALRQIHAVLNDEQRARAATFLREGLPAWAVGPAGA